MIADLLGTDTTESPAAQGHESRAIRRIGAVAAGLATAVRREPDLAVLAFVVLTLPLELSKQWFPIQILEISRVGMIVGIGILVLRAIRGRLDPVPRGLVWGTVLLIAVSGASVLLTWWPHGIRIEAAIIVYAAFALFVAQTARDRRRMTIVGWILIISGVFIAVVLLVEALGDFYIWREGAQGVLGRRNATFGDPNITSRFLTLAILAVLTFIASTDNARRRTLILLFSALVLFGMGQALTQSRAGWLVAAVPLFAWVWLVRSWIRGVAPVLVLLAGFAGTLILNPTALLRAESVAGDVGHVVGFITNPDDPTNPLGPDVSVDSGPPLAIDPLLDRVPLDSVRRYLARAGIAMFLDHPLAGVGLGGFQPQILDHYAAYIPPDRRASPTSLPHTEAVRIVAETGLVGLFVSIAFFAALFLCLIRSRAVGGQLRLAPLSLGLGLVVIGTASQFEGRLYDEPYLWLFVGLVAALSGIIRTTQGSGAPMKVGP